MEADVRRVTGARGKKGNVHVFGKESLPLREMILQRWLAVYKRQCCVAQTELDLPLELGVGENEWKRDHRHVCAYGRREKEQHLLFKLVQFSCPTLRDSFGQRKRGGPKPTPSTISHSRSCFLRFPNTCVLFFGVRLMYERSNTVL
ncbi:hypothetical protein AMELA_G00264300 [Ameiurus melas]|uniref:Uncharacterized protein n=1 Tax=Ameiurus melas TaxID=219545 RepID=A0A7J5ZPG8_AMEME|nr:hypothetical protein AMELA_G00264300 [Ameiurus melas]